MTNLITDALGDLFSLTGLIAFVAGHLATRLYFYVKCRYQDHVDPSNKPHTSSYRGLAFLWAMVFVISGYSGMQTYSTAAEVRQLSMDTAHCQEEFNRALKARAQITTDNDKWSAIQRRAIAEWLHEILLPPPDIQNLRDNDPNFGTNPRYVQWSIDVTTRYYNIIQKAQDEQDANAKERENHPLPEPACGR
jgi:hypothetical protein